MNRWIRGAARLAATLPGELAAGWRRGGLAGLRNVLARRLVRRLYRRLDLLLLEVDLPPAAATPTDDAGPTGLRIAPFHGPWTRLETIPGQVPIARMAQWAAGGMTCLLAEREGAPVGYQWVDPGFAGARYPAAPELPADTVYLRNVYVLASERGRGLGRALIAAGLAHAAAGGYRAARWTVRPDNHSSLRAFERAAGAPSRLLGRLTYTRVLGRRRRRYVPAEELRA